MKVSRASFYFLDHDIQKTFEGTRFCIETSSYKNEIQRHTETEPGFILVKNVHESFTDNGKTNKNVTLQKRSLKTAKMSISLSRNNINPLVLLV